MRSRKLHLKSPRLPASVVKFLAPATSKKAHQADVTAIKRDLLYPNRSSV